MSGYVDICNMALMRIGTSQTIASLDEGSTQAKVCSVWYQAVRDRILRSYPWRFAERRVSLAQSTDAAPTNWKQVYQVPSDCLKVRSIVVPGTRQPRVSQKIPFQLANDGTGMVIYCDLPTVEMIYTAQITDATLFDPLFVSAYAALLASEICLPLSVAPAVAAQARQMFTIEIANAAAMAMSEGFDGPEPESEFTAVRNFPDMVQGYNPWAAYPGGYFVG